jgi:RNA polymerase sigma-70 factor (ECF subfamily)
LLEEHKKILFKIASSYCPYPADRDDLVQEMTLQLWRSFGRYDDRQRFSTWMYRVSLNVAISFYRREARRSRATVPAGDAILDIAVAETAVLAINDDLRMLHRFIQQLDELDRALIILYLDGNRHDTIAEVLGISESNVGTKISRIKQRLRREWASYSIEEHTHGSR